MVSVLPNVVHPYVIVFIIQLKTYHTFFKQAGSVGNDLVVSGDERTWCFRKGCSMRLM